MKILSTLLVLTVLALAFTSCKSTPTQKEASEYMDDSVITAKVKTAVLREPKLKVSEINVETHEGTVQLSGFVGNQECILLAGAVARDVEGVKLVTNSLLIK
ncbi:MAG: transporter [Deltaproteobacteria bacterium HGW-Deltaproteobacteria-22]|nr:MAG: transporter [Deltaproteobacteria bacterium HGW-Deltaproteobacteria-22]